MPDYIPDRGKENPTTIQEYRNIDCPEQKEQKLICQTLKQETIQMMQQPDRFELPANSPSQICEGLCSFPAEAVLDSLNLPHLRLVEAGMMNFAHLWLEHKGKHYDPERPAGVYDYRKLPVFGRQTGEPGPLTVIRENDA